MIQFAKKSLLTVSALALLTFAGISQASTHPATERAPAVPAHPRESRSVVGPSRGGCLPPKNHQYRVYYRSSPDEGWKVHGVFARADQAQQAVKMLKEAGLEAYDDVPKPVPAPKKVAR
jgi:hypothetical protein